MSSIKIMPVIMSGGAGSRLWPLSRKAMPKQLLALLGQNTMIQETVLRLNGADFLPPVFVCSADHADPIAAQMAMMKHDVGAIIIEPMPRNTAPCAVAAACHALASREMGGGGGHAPLVLLLPADHHVQKPDAFVQAIRNAVPAAQSGKLVTFGIKPERAETGYGYIQRGAAIDDHAFAVKAFVEKPDAQTAQHYVADGGYDWNGGIFLFAPGIFLQDIQDHAPEISAQAQKAYDRADRSQAHYEGERITLEATAFAACPSQSIDYAVMEPTDKAAIVPADIGWNDIGSYATLHAMRQPGGPAGNALTGDVLLHDTKDCLIDTDGPLVAAVGVEGLSIIVREGMILVARLDAAQDVKQIVTELKSLGRETCL